MHLDKTSTLTALHGEKLVVVVVARDKLVVVFVAGDELIIAVVTVRRHPIIAVIWSSGSLDSHLFNGKTSVHPWPICFNSRSATSLTQFDSRLQFDASNMVEGQRRHRWPTGQRGPVGLPREPLNPAAESGPLMGSGVRAPLRRYRHQQDLRRGPPNALLARATIVGEGEVKEAVGDRPCALCGAQDKDRGMGWEMMLYEGIVLRVRAKGGELGTVIWYQGESDTILCEDTGGGGGGQMERLIWDLRADFGLLELLLIQMTPPQRVTLAQQGLEPGT
ncbi:putative carbohydrate esterase [Canna indica]|uniref:Carbohydrate esterase n=1 Tax=Canna indica TaxID=4628 RepID=A0AAQ3QMK7_9LILI|nr:putative carbohydrate esterase [Canna indica]